MGTFLGLTGTFFLIAGANYLLAANGPPPLPALPPLPSSSTGPAGVASLPPLPQLPPLPNPSGYSSNSASNGPPPLSFPNDNSPENQLLLPGEKPVLGPAPTPVPVATAPKPFPTFEPTPKPTVAPAKNGKGKKGNVDKNNKPTKLAKTVKSNKNVLPVKQQGRNNRLILPVKAKKEDKTEKEFSKDEIPDDLLKGYRYQTIKDRMPDEIYRKEYDGPNRHLPVALYEIDYDSMMFVAAENNDTNGLRSLMHTGRSANMTDQAGDTPLLVAVKNDSIDAVRLLLVHNADRYAVDSTGRTAKQVAMQMGDPNLINAFSEDN